MPALAKVLSSSRQSDASSSTSSRSSRFAVSTAAPRRRLAGPRAARRTRSSLVWRYCRRHITRSSSSTASTTTAPGCSRLIRLNAPRVPGPRDHVLAQRDHPVVAVQVLAGHDGPGHRSVCEGFHARFSGASGMPRTLARMEILGTVTLMTLATLTKHEAATALGPPRGAALRHRGRHDRPARGRDLVASTQHDHLHLQRARRDDLRRRASPRSAGHAQRRGRSTSRAARRAAAAAGAGGRQRAGRRGQHDQHRHRRGHPAHGRPHRQARLRLDQPRARRGPPGVGLLRPARPQGAPPRSP